jgi:hypothetical protein
MPEGPNGQRRPGDVIGAGAMVARTAKGEVQDNAAPADKAHPSAGGKKGGAARAKPLSSSERAEIARRAARTRWPKE